MHISGYMNILNLSYVKTEEKKQQMFTFKKLKQSFIYILFISVVGTSWFETSDAVRGLLLKNN